MSDPDLFDYSGLPYQRHSDTSLQAAIEAEPAAGTQRRRVFDLMFMAPRGLTDHQMQEFLNMNPSTQRPRRIELVERGFVRDSGMRRQTPSGRWAVVWVMVKRGDDAISQVLGE